MKYKRNMRKLVWSFLLLLMIVGSVMWTKGNSGDVRCLRAVTLTLVFSLALIGEILQSIQICLLTILLMPMLGITSGLSETLCGFSNAVVAFIVASCGIAAAFSKTFVSRRLLLLFIRRTSRIEVLIGALMFCAAFTSAFMSNVPTCVIYMSLGIRLLDLYVAEADKKKTGKTIMLGVTMASMIGGMATPVGSSINILALQLLEEYTGGGISFIRWVCVAVPVVILVLPICWLLIVHIFKPVSLRKEDVTKFAENLTVPNRMTGEEIRFCLIMTVMLVLWIAASWIPDINVIMVTLVGCLVLQLPVIGVIRMEDFLHSVPPEAIFIVATVLSLGSAVAENGFAGLWGASSMLSLPKFAVFLVVAGMVFAGLLLIPVAPSLVTVLAPGIVAIGALSGVSPEALIMLCALCAGNCYLLPFDTVCQITYAKGYYSMREMARVGSLLQIWVAVVASVCVYIDFSVIQ